MFRLHKKIHEREWTGKPAKIMDVSYVIIYNPFLCFTKTDIKKYYFQQDQLNNSCIVCKKAYASELEAENHFLQTYKEALLAEKKAAGVERSLSLEYFFRFLKNPKSGLDKDIEFKPADFQKNTYFLATIKGTPEEVTKMIQHGARIFGFGKKILSVRDNSKTTFLVNPNAVLVDHKSVKEEEKPSLSNYSWIG